jgi:hypothetical protein
MGRQQELPFIRCQASPNIRLLPFTTFSVIAEPTRAPAQNEDDEDDTPNNIEGDDEDEPGEDEDDEGTSDTNLVLAQILF